MLNIDIMEMIMQSCVPEDIMKFYITTKTDNKWMKPMKTNIIVKRQHQLNEIISSMDLLLWHLGYKDNTDTYQKWINIQVLDDVKKIVRINGITMEQIHNYFNKASLTMLNKMIDAINTKLENVIEHKSMLIDQIRTAMEFYSEIYPYENFWGKVYFQLCDLDYGEKDDVINTINNMSLFELIRERGVWC
jgi:hypothetical protein